MRILILCICIIVALQTIAQNSPNCKLLQPGKIIAQNNITKTSTPANQFVLSILETNPPNTYSNINIYKHPKWTNEKIGNTTKAVYDDEGNMYVAASSLYVSGSKLDCWRYGEIGGGADDLEAAGTIYKLNAYTGEPEVLYRVPQQQFANVPIIFITFSAMRLTGPGVSDISYNSKHQQILAANNEDGKIYQLSKDGNLIDTFDPGTLDDGSVGFTPKEERITAIASKGNLIYYAIWGNNSSYIASVKIKQNQTIQTNSAKVEKLLSDIDQISDPSLPIIQIALNDDNLMVVTQSTLLNDVTKAEENHPIIIFKEKSKKWNFAYLLNELDEQVGIHYSTISFTNDLNSYNQNNDNQGNDDDQNGNIQNEEVKIAYVTSDLYDNNYLFGVDLVESPSLSINNYEQYEIPGLLGKIQFANVVDQNKLLDPDYICTVNTKIEDGISDITIYPNPASNSFHLKGISIDDIDQIKLFDATGKLVKQVDGNFTTIRTINLLSGVYLINIIAGKEVFTEKLIIK